jgi:hypothetical protein
LPMYYIGNFALVHESCHRGCPAYYIIVLFDNTFGLTPSSS